MGVSSTIPRKHPLHKNGSCTTELEIVEWGRKISGVLKAATRNRNVSIGVKKVLHDKMLLPAMLYGRESWTLLKGQTVRLRAVEIRYLSSACVVT